MRDIKMTTKRADLIVFAKDYPEVRLVGEVKPSLSTPLDLDSAVRQIAHYMWGANCHYGLIFTPKTTYVLRDDFTAQGPEAIRVSEALSTERLLSRLGIPASEIASGRQLESAAQSWLERLAASYEAALPEDAEITRALFPEVVGAFAEGRVVSEVAVR
jgi:hypothetical protein